MSLMSPKSLPQEWPSPVGSLPQTPVPLYSPSGSDFSYDDISLKSPRTPQSVSSFGENEIVTDHSPQPTTPQPSSPTYDLDELLRTSKPLTEEEFQKFISDIDLSLLDEPRSDDLFEKPRKFVHPDSEKIRNVLGPSPFEENQDSESPVCEGFDIVNYGALSEDSDKCPESPVHEGMDIIDYISMFKTEEKSEVTKPPGKNKKSCPNCGSLITPSYMNRHLKTKKCMGSASDVVSVKQQISQSTKKKTAPVKVAKKPCQKCGALVTPSNMKRHQKSKKCIAGQTGLDINFKKDTPVEEKVDTSPFANLDDDLFTQPRGSRGQKPFARLHDDLFTAPRSERIGNPFAGLHGDLFTSPRGPRENKPFARLHDDVFTAPRGERLSKPFAGLHDDVFTAPREERRPPYVVTETASRFVKKYGTTQVDYTIRVNKAMEIENAINAMLKLAKTKGNYKKGDKITIVASHPDFNHDISTVVQSDIKARMFMEHVANILTSNEEMDITQTRFNVKIINIPHGQGSSQKIFNLANDLRTKRCITRINNKDNLCCPRAIITALTYHWDNLLDRPISKPQIKQIRLGKRLQGELARELCKRLGDYNEEGFTLEDIRNSERLLGVQIKIVCAENFNSIIYSGEAADTILYLYKNGNHFDVINSMRALLGRSYYCQRCDKPYNNKDSHKCKSKNVCNMCMRAEHDESLATLYCERCNRYCYNEECLANHGDVCAKIYKCRVCNKVLEREKTHSCYHYFCRNCHEVAEYNKHKCHMQPVSAKGGVCGCPKCTPGSAQEINKKCSYSEKYLFFDYEAQQDTGVHEANLIKVHNFNGDKWTFYDNDSFCKWLISKEHKGYTCIAHYAKGYDSYFILRYCIENTIRPYTIYSGSKLMLLEIPGCLKIIDSMNFVASPLASFPKTFGLTELKKGYFPYLFNTRENQNYVGPIPNIKYYSPDTMKPEPREAFLRWHAARVAENYVFDFKREIEQYCDSDVDILRRGCLELRKQFLEIANIDPFRYLTIASVCMAVYRSKYMPQKAIAVVNTDRRDQYSRESITWLETFSKVRHALNGGEVVICGSKVDGYCEETNTVYQYHGCFWHGCLKCYKPDTINNVNKHSMGDLYNKTSEHTAQLQRAGYNVVEMWECEWLPKYKKMREEEKPEVIEGLKPRDAFFGGRTNASKLKVSGKKLKYIDVVSLYPTVMFEDPYPIGHPVKIKNPKRYNPEWFGLVKCKVVAPRGLYHPVLPVKKEKLLFPLCVKCADEKCRVCEHSENERAFSGTWTTIEMNKALEKGYKILEIYEVWHFKERSNKLFRGYIRDFMKIKLETSSWEKDFATKEAYAAAIKQNMGIELDINKIEDNPGKRAVAKICLNSLWGKFGQRQNMKQTVYVTDPSEFYKILLNDTLDTTNITLINDNIVQISYAKKDCYVEDPNNINVFVATFTTANARLRLYDMLDRLGESVAYYDTDSVFYIDNGTNTVETGCMLGEWNDELGKDTYINDWISTGPKSYAYGVTKGNGCVKIKGFTLNFSNSERLNINSMKKILDGELERINIDYNQIVRDGSTKKLFNRKMNKAFTLKYDKRLIVPKNDVVDTLPWGYY